MSQILPLRYNILYQPMYLQKISVPTLKLRVCYFNWIANKTNGKYTCMHATFKLECISIFIPTKLRLFTYFYFYIYSRCCCFFYAWRKSLSFSPKQPPGTLNWLHLKQKNKMSKEKMYICILLCVFSFYLRELCRVFFFW